MSLDYGPIECGLELASRGKRAGHFSLTHSDDRYGFSAIRSPLGIVRGGNGPVALVCAGNHGDEYEGQIIVRRLFERLEPEDLAGALILAPALNMPAVTAVRRVSPLDAGNLNRSFPGAVDEGPTRAIAGFVAARLMPLADVAVDLHSGGRSVDFLDCSYLCLSEDPEQTRRTHALADAMGLAHTMVVPPGDTVGDFDGAAQAAGCATLSCELGGEAKLSPRALSAGWDGVLRVLAHAGVLTPEAVRRFGIAAAPASRLLDLGAGAAFVTSDGHGLAEPLASIGDEVRRGQTVALLRDVGRLSEASPIPIDAPQDGIVVIRRRGVLVAPGDHLYVIAKALSGLPDGFE